VNEEAAQGSDYREDDEDPSEDEAPEDEAPEDEAPEDEAPEDEAPLETSVLGKRRTKLQLERYGPT
jgi:hypothetical protein